MITTLLAALAPVALPPLQEPDAPADPTSLQALTDQAWRIVSGRVAEVREFAREQESAPVSRGVSHHYGDGAGRWRDRVVWYARVAVERPLLGAEQELWVLAGDLVAGTGRLLVAGDDVLLFLVPVSAEASGARSALGVEPNPWLVRPVPRGDGAEEALADEVLYQPLRGGCWKRGYGGYAPPDTVAPALPDELSGDLPHVAPEAVESWIAARLDATCPTALATLRTTGPTSPLLEIAADGAYSTTPQMWTAAERETGRFAPEELAPFWSAVGTFAFFELPRRLQARSGGPESPTITLRLRTRERGTHAVRLLGLDRPREPVPAEPTPVERAIHVFRALPGDVFPRPGR